jgi:hypothetical protein
VKSLNIAAGKASLSIPILEKIKNCANITSLALGFSMEVSKKPLDPRKVEPLFRCLPFLAKLKLYAIVVDDEVCLCFSFLFFSFLFFSFLFFSFLFFSFLFFSFLFFSSVAAASFLCVFINLFPFS